jgi:hypothetical protein
LQTRCSPHSIVAKLATKSNSTAPSCGVISGRSKRVGLANDRQKSIPTQLRKNRTCAFLDKLQPPYLATRCISSALTSGVRPHGLSLRRSSFPAPKPCFETDCSRPISCRSFPTWNRLLESRRPARAIPDLRSQRSLVFDRRFGKAIGTDRGSENLIQVGQSWS